MTNRYSDIDLDFVDHPATGDIVKKVNVEAVKRSVRNLVNLNHYDKPFHPEIGSNVRSLLFENVSPLTAIAIKTSIIETIENFEPRVDLIEVAVKASVDETGYEVAVQFNVLNIQQPYSIDLFLERL